MTPFSLFNTTYAGGAYDAGEVRSYQVTGVGGIPTTGVSAVVVDIGATSTNVTTSSYVTLWPNGVTRPVIGNMYYTGANVPRSNTAVVKVGTGGKINVFNYAGTTHLNVDVQGYFTTTSGDGSPGGFVPITPKRVARTDTGTGMTAGMVPVGGYRDIQVTDGDDIPADATAVFANIEVRNHTADGRLKIGKGGVSTSTLPPAVNYAAASGPTNSGMTIPLSTNGKIRVTNDSGSATDFKVDIQGYFSGDPTQGGSFTPMVAQNIYSTGWTGQPELGAGETLTVKLAGVAGIPNDGSVAAVAMSVTARNWTTGGTITLYNAEEGLPGTTSVSFSGGQGVPSNGISSTAIVALSEHGKIKIHNSSTNPVGITLVGQGWFTSYRTPAQQAIFVALSNASVGTATATELALIKAENLESAVPSQDVPEVEAVDEEDDLSDDYPETPEEIAAPGETCNSTDPNCVIGTTTEDEPTADLPLVHPMSAAFATAASSVCGSGARARKYTVKLKKKSLLRTTQYVFGHRVHYCTKGGKVTKFRSRYDFFEEVDGNVKIRGRIVNSAAGTGSSTATSHIQRHVELCVIKYGCYADIYPWSKLKVTGNGGKSYTGRAQG